MKAADVAKTVGAILLGSAILFFQWKAQDRREEARNRELVQTLELSGDTYSLYFHRRADYYSTIHKNGELIFDGREHPALHSCIQELVVIESVVHRRCYLSQKKEVVTVALD